MNQTLAIISAALLGVAMNAAETPPPPKEKPPCCRVPAPSGQYADKSLFQLDSTWTSDAGRDVKLGVLHGRVQVVALFFTACEFSCPVIVNDLRRIQAALPGSLRDRVDFLLVSMDSQRDTPQVLRAYRERQKLDTAHWTLLRGKPDDVRELSALLGVNYREDSRGQFAHSNLITVLNPQGEIIHQQSGLNHDPAPSIAVIQSVLLPAAPPAKP